MNETKGSQKFKILLLCFERTEFYRPDSTVERSYVILHPERTRSFTRCEKRTSKIAAHFVEGGSRDHLCQFECKIFSFSLLHGAIVKPIFMLRSLCSCTVVIVTEHRTFNIAHFLPKATLRVNSVVITF